MWRLWKKKYKFRDKKKKKIKADEIATCLLIRCAEWGSWNLAEEVRWWWSYPIWTNQSKMQWPHQKISRGKKGKKKKIIIKSRVV